MYMCCSRKFEILFFLRYIINKIFVMGWWIDEYVVYKKLEKSSINVFYVFGNFLKKVLK